MGDDDDDQDGCEDHGGEDHEDDDHEGDVEDDQGGEAHYREEGPERDWQEERDGHEEGRQGHLRPEEAQRCAGGCLRCEDSPRTEVTKKVWVYIKKHGLNNGRTIKPDSTLKAIFPVPSLDMLKMAGHISKHLS